MKIELDTSDTGILALLQANARASDAEIGACVQLCAADVALRIARMEQAGVISGYHARINPGALGHGISAFIRITCRGHVTPLEVVASQVPGIIECHSVTGDHDGIVRVVAQDVAELEKIIIELMRCGVTSTSLILSSPVAQKSILPAI